MGGHVQKIKCGPGGWKGAVNEQPFEHQPVLVAPLLELLEPRPGQVVLDGTVGLGGHAAALLPRILPGGRYIGIDLDEQMLAEARRRLDSVAGAALQLFAANYADFAAVLALAGLDEVDHMLLDLGVNSAQLADAQRGFSFDRDGPLDMRFDQAQQTRALDLVNGLSERELSDLFYFNAQEPQSRKIARRICQVRHAGRITTTSALARAVEAVVGDGGKIHPATRVFQALRIAVNQELDNLRRFLDQVAGHLKPGGRLAVISFHSLEDGIVKQYMRTAKAAGTLEELTKRPVIAEPGERDTNPRSRSAKLRVAERRQS
jgi:16S rRNA (cytosine1402-N4)-methyltransferase